MKRAVAYVLAVLAIALAVLVAGTTSASATATRLEDSRNCVWDAGVSGNGRGHSFVDLRGTAYYF